MSRVVSNQLFSEVGCRELRHSGSTLSLLEGIRSNLHSILWRLPKVKCVPRLNDGLCVLSLHSSETVLNDSELSRPSIILLQPRAALLVFGCAARGQQRLIVRQTCVPFLTVGRGLSSSCSCRLLLPGSQFEALQHGSLTVLMERCLNWQIEQPMYIIPRLCHHLYNICTK